MKRKTPSDFPPQVLDLFERLVYGFHNDTTPRYDEKAARLAWQRTVEFLRKNLA